MSRQDYLNDPNAPQPNSIVVACSAFVENDNKSILMIRRTDNGYYSIPGGRLEPGESLTECAVRETFEETAIEIEVAGLIGIYSNPRHVIKYDDGEVRQEFSICFRAIQTGGDPRTSDESTEVKWVSPDQLSQLAIHRSTLLRIGHGLRGSAAPYYS